MGIKIILWGCKLKLFVVFVFYIWLLYFVFMFFCYGVRYLDNLLEIIWIVSCGFCGYDIFYIKKRKLIIFMKFDWKDLERS